MSNDLYNLVDSTYIKYDKSSLNAKNVEYVKYELNPIFREVTLVEILDIGKQYLPKNWNGDIKNIKQNYRNIIKIVHKYDTIFLVFEQENYFLYLVLK